MRRILSTTACALIFFCACSDNNLGTPSGDGGTSSNGDDAAPSNDGGTIEDGGTNNDAASGAIATQSGQIVDAISNKGIGGATIDFGNGITTTTDSSGNYSLKTSQNTPFNTIVTAATYPQRIEQEWELTGDFMVGETAVPSGSLFGTQLSGLSEYDSTKGALEVAVEITGACTDNGGSVITLDPPSAGKIIYFDGTTPSAGATSVKSGSVAPSALVYNLDLAGTAKVSVTPPTGCSAAAFPFTQGTVTYTGNWKVEAGSSSISFFRIFLK